MSLKLRRDISLIPWGRNSGHTCWVLDSAVVRDITLIWSDTHEWKLWAMWTFCIVNSVLRLIQCIWRIIFILPLFCAFSFEKCKEEIEAFYKLSTGKMKEFDFLRSHTESPWHSFCRIKVWGLKSFLLKPYKIFFSNTMNANRIQNTVEISSHERNLCSEAKKVTRGKRYFGSEQNVLFMALLSLLMFFQSSRNNE